MKMLNCTLKYVCAVVSKKIDKFKSAHAHRLRRAHKKMAL